MRFHLPDGLPSLDGRRGAMVQRIYWVGATLITVITLAGALLVGVQYLVNFPAESHYGFQIGEDDLGHVVVAGHDPSAKSAGLQIGDRVVAIADIPLASRATSIDAASLLPRPNGPVTISARDASGQISRHRLAWRDGIDDARDPDSGLPLAMAGIIHVAQRLIVPLVLIGISLLLARKRPRDSEVMLLAFGLLLIAFGNTADLWLWQLHLPLSIGAVAWSESVLGVLGFWAMFVGLCAFPDGRFATRWARLAWMLPTAYVLANAATNFVLWKHRLVALALDVAIFAIVVGSVLLRFRTTPAGVQRQQIKWALFGGATMIVAAIVGLIIGPGRLDSSLGRTGAYLFAVFQDDLENLAFPLGLLVSLLRYRLYDADTVITRSTAYAVLAVALVAVFACTEKVIELLGEEYFGQRLGVLAGGLGAAIAAVLVAPLHHRISHWVEHRFRHELLHLRQSLPTLISTHLSTSTPADLAKATLQSAAHSLRAVCGAVIGDAGEVFAAHRLSEDEIAQWWTGWARRDRENDSVENKESLLPVQLPLAIAGAKPLGWLMLGARPDGSLYGKDERAILSDVADALAGGLTLVLQRQARLAAEQRERAALIQRLDHLERTVSRLSMIQEMSVRDPIA